MNKTLMQSKTFWFNALSTIVGMAAYLSSSELVAENPAVVAVFTGIITLGNIVLRLFTNKPIKK